MRFAEQLKDASSLALEVLGAEGMLADGEWARVFLTAPSTSATVCGSISSSGSTMDSGAGDQIRRPSQNATESHAVAARVLRSEPDGGSVRLPSGPIAATVDAEPPTPPARHR